MAALSALQPQITLKEKKITYESPSYPAKAYLLGHSKEPFMKVMDMDRMIILSEGQNLAHNFYQYSSNRVLTQRSSKSTKKLPS